MRSLAIVDARTASSLRKQGPIAPALSRGNGVWVPAFAGTTRRVLHRFHFSRSRPSGVAPECSANWCARRDLNPQGITRRILSAVRLPVPPRAQSLKRQWGRQGESNTRHPAYEGGGLPLAYTGIVASFAETRALAHERPTGRRGALCTRAPSWTFTSFDPCGSQFMQASRRTAGSAAPAGCRGAATRAMTLRPRITRLICWYSCGPSGPSACCGGQWSPRVKLVLRRARIRTVSSVARIHYRTHTADRSGDCSARRLLRVRYLCKS
jgi:hypothetical protein